MNCVRTFPSICTRPRHALGQYRTWRSTLQEELQRTSRAAWRLACGKSLSVYSCVHSTSALAASINGSSNPAINSTAASINGSTASVNGSTAPINGSAETDLGGGPRGVGGHAVVALACAPYARCVRYATYVSVRYATTYASESRTRRRCIRRIRHGVVTVCSPSHQKVTVCGHEVTWRSRGHDVVTVWSRWSRCGHDGGGGGGHEGEGSCPARRTSPWRARPRMIRAVSTRHMA
eukprot:620814-Rhodomonas_salina.3